MRISVIFLLVAFFISSCSHTPEPVLEKGPAYRYSPYSLDHDCETFSENVGALAVQRLRSIDGRCTIFVKHSNAQKSWYRNYQISSTGMLLIFNSFGNGSGSSHTGSRAFYLFPRKTAPDFTITESGDIEVMTPTSETIRFSSKTKKISEISGGIKYQEVDLIAGSNKGGIEITALPKGIILDAGWEIGGMAAEKPHRTSVFIDDAGNRCEVKNYEIFEIKRGEPYLRFETDQALLEYLDRRCNGLRLDGLKGHLYPSES